jgi:hypothetical protein
MKVSFFIHLRRLILNFKLEYLQLLPFSLFIILFSHPFLSKYFEDVIKLKNKYFTGMKAA